MTDYSILTENSIFVVSSEIFTSILSVTQHVKISWNGKNDLKYITLGNFDEDHVVRYTLYIGSMTFFNCNTTKVIVIL